MGRRALQRSSGRCVKGEPFGLGRGMGRQSKDEWFIQSRSLLSLKFFVGGR